MDGVGLVAATFAVSLVGGLVPLINVEAYLLSVSALLPEAGLVPLVAAASLGQMAAKALLYFAGGGALRLPLCRNGKRLEAAIERLRGAGEHAQAVVFASALLGLPPFYLVSVAAGVLRLRLGVFLALGFGGRLLRFAAVFLLPRWLS